MATTDNQKSDGDDAAAAQPKQTAPFHPIFFAIYPALSLFSSNVEFASLSEVVAPVVVGALTALLLICIFGALTRSAQRGAILATLTIGLLFGYRLIHGIFDANWVSLVREEPVAEWTFRFLLLCIGFLLALILSKFSSALAFGTRLLNFVSATMCVVAIGSISIQLVRLPAKPVRPNVSGIRPSPALAEKLPNVYYIILDSYGREDSLRRYMEIDTRPFVEGLRSRGFYVASDSTTNYHQTQLSLSSSMNMEYNHTLFKGITDGTRGTLNRSSLDGKVPHLFRDLGYRYVFVGSGCLFLDGRWADKFMQANIRSISPYLTTLLEFTPFAVRGGRSLKAEEGKRAHVRYAIGVLDEVKDQAGSPFFALVHVLSPHPPFVFHEDGSPRKPEKSGVAEGEVLGEYGMTVEQYKDGYGGQALYTADLMLKELDELLKADPEALIIVQGDHGSKSLHREEPNRSALAEEFPILNAYRVPEQIRQKLYPSITPVNTFRVVLSEISDQKFDLLPDRSYFATWDDPFTYVDITERLNQQVVQLRAGLKDAKDP